MRRGGDGSRELPQPPALQVRKEEEDGVEEEEEVDHAKRARLTWTLDHCTEKSCKSINLLLCSLNIELLAVLSFLFAIHVRFQVLFSLLIKPDFDQWRGRIPRRHPHFPCPSFIHFTHEGDITAKLLPKECKPQKAWF